MEYSSNKLSRMSGVSARTLRYYDEIGLLKPVRVASSGYRIYGQSELDTLQQILFYKELSFPLDVIKKLLLAPDFKREQAFDDHLAELYKRRERLDVLIRNVKKTIASMKGEIIMADKEKFEGFKQSLIDENERKFGAEVRAKYGSKIVDESNARLKGMSQEQYDKSEQLRLALEETLKAAFKSGDPAGELAQKACEIHRQWLCVFYPEYNKEYHKSLGEMYVADERFRKNYDKLAPGCAEFFRDSINIYCL
ncbi:MAG: MerR family transcriptional regulator [Oscillospiraceae bacterium]|nr:MerR family transcriptional regulator [Oscillospiraceae bacterium]